MMPQLVSAAGLTRMLASALLAENLTSRPLLVGFSPKAGQLLLRNQDLVGWPPRKLTEHLHAVSVGSGSRSSRRSFSPRHRQDTTAPSELRYECVACSPISIALVRLLVVDCSDQAQLKVQKRFRGLAVDLRRNHQNRDNAQRSVSMILRDVWLTIIRHVGIVRRSPPESAVYSCPCRQWQRSNSRFANRLHITTVSQLNRGRDSSVPWQARSASRQTAKGWPVSRGRPEQAAQA